MATISSRTGPQIPRAVLAAQVLIGVAAVACAALFATVALDGSIRHQLNFKAGGVEALAAAVLLAGQFVLVQRRFRRARGLLVIPAALTIECVFNHTVYGVPGPHLDLLAVAAWYAAIVLLLNAPASEAWFVSEPLTVPYTRAACVGWAIGTGVGLVVAVLCLSNVLGSQVAWLDYPADQWRDANWASRSGTGAVYVLLVVIVAITVAAPCWRRLRMLLTMPRRQAVQPAQ